MTKLSLAAIAAASLLSLACHGDTDDATTTMPTSGPTTLPPASSSDTGMPTTGDSTTTDTTSTLMTTSSDDTTGEPPEDCVDPAVSCERLVTNATDFCDAIAQFGVSRSIEEPYIGFVIAQCEASAPKCEVCFELENYCMQVGEACQGLKSLCACVGEAFGVP